jgi:hypothetical protein
MAIFTVQCLEAERVTGFRLHCADLRTERRRRSLVYTPADCRGWLKAAGFRKTTLVPLTATESMLITK